MKSHHSYRVALANAIGSNLMLTDVRANSRGEAVVEAVRISQERGHKSMVVTSLSTNKNVEVV